MQRAIVAIGGGDIRTRGTLLIDREIIRLTGKQHPRLLFIPTASGDSEKYCRHVEEYFGGYLKCSVDLLLLTQLPSWSKIEDKILGTDAVYVGGGNTLAMMREWRRCGVDRLLRIAYKSGVVMSGISAGAICWFQSGHSDSLSFTHPDGWKYINVRGLGLLPGIHCPHYNSRTRGVPRRRDFREMIGKIGGIGIALENNCAIEFIDRRLYKVIASKNHARAYRLYRDHGRVITEQIHREQRLAPFSRFFHIRKIDPSI